MGQLPARDAQLDGVVPEIARRLHLSPFTVQDHLKAIFDKVGARTRGEITARRYFDGHLP